MDDGRDGGACRVTEKIPEKSEKIPARRVVNGDVARKKLRHSVGWVRRYRQNQVWWMTQTCWGCSRGTRGWKMVILGLDGRPWQGESAPGESVGGWPAGGWQRG